MKTLRHKMRGTAQIVGRDEKFITIKYDRDGYVSNVKFPEGLASDMFVLDEELQREVDAAVEAKNEAERIAREEREAARKQAQLTQAAPVKVSRTSKKPAKIKIKGAIEQDFENYLIASGYSIETPSGNPSTVNSYITAVNSILGDERLSWNSLIDQIDRIVPIYDEGGAKADIGSKSNYTYLNALRRFQDFVNNSAL